MSGRVVVFLRELVEGFDLLLVDSDGEDFLLLELVGMSLISFDDHESVVFVEFDLTGSEEDFGEEVLFFEYFLIVGLL